LKRQLPKHVAVNVQLAHEAIAVIAVEIVVAITVVVQLVVGAVVITPINKEIEPC